MGSSFIYLIRIDSNEFSICTILKECAYMFPLNFLLKFLKFVLS